MKVTIVQNSNENARVHKAGCADIRRRELRDHGYLSSWDADVASQREAAVAAWSDHVAGGEMTREAALGYTTFLPCCGELPETAGPDAARQVLTVVIPLTDTMRTPVDLAAALRQAAFQVQAGHGNGRIRDKMNNFAGEFDITTTHTETGATT